MNLQNHWNCLTATYSTLPPNGRVMAKVVAVHAAILPIGNTFVATYILRQGSNDFSHAMAYQLGCYAGVLILSYANGWLLGHISPKTLFGWGIMLTGTVLFAIASLPMLSFGGIALSGVAMGAAGGLFWCNRNLLVQQATDEHCRAAFYGFEMFFQSLFLVLTPLAAGLLVTRFPDWGYMWLGAFTMAVNALTLALFLPGRFQKETVQLEAFPGRNDFQWHLVLLSDAVKGIAQTFLMLIPAVVIMRNLGGNEAGVGVVQSLGGIASGVGVLWLGGRLGHRGEVRLLAAAGILYALASIWMGVVFDSTALSWLLGSVILAQPALDLGFFPIQMDATDRARLRCGGSLYSYIAAHEAAYFIGRTVGIGLFLGAWQLGGEFWAMRIALPALAVAHLASIPLAAKIASGLN